MYPHFCAARLTNPDFGKGSVKGHGAEASGGLRRPAPSFSPNPVVLPKAGRLGSGGIQRNKGKHLWGSYTLASRNNLSMHAIIPLHWGHSLGARAVSLLQPMLQLTNHHGGGFWYSKMERDAVR